ncbi:hypothetical protein HT031_000340 [Scenedesmus sp. PABB004]|nr:hypothetical protein HT031_000340 [Scenedesmus sp. PABB004]
MLAIIQRTPPPPAPATTTSPSATTTTSASATTTSPSASASPALHHLSSARQYATCTRAPASGSPLLRLAGTPRARGSAGHPCRLAAEPPPPACLPSLTPTDVGRACGRACRRASLLVEAPNSTRSAGATKPRPRGKPGAAPSGAPCLWHTAA